MAEWAEGGRRGAGDGEDEEMPWELALWLKVRDWGDPWGAGWMKWPAQLFTRARLARNVYGVWQKYTAAPDRVKWLKANPGGANVVGVVKEFRYGVVEVEREEWPPRGYVMWLRRYRGK